MPDPGLALPVETSGPVPVLSGDGPRDLPPLVSAEETRRQYWAMRRREWYILAAILAVVLVIGFNFKPAQVSGVSMMPTYHNGDIVLVWKTAHLLQPYKPGDVIVFKRENGEELIKRIIFVQAPDGSGRIPFRIPTPRGLIPVPILLWVSGHRWFPHYIDDVLAARNGTKIRKTIYVMGDNFRNSLDSRDFGGIDPAAVLGKVVRVISRHS